MAFTGSLVCTNFKTDLLSGRANFNSTGGNAYWLSLYTSSATLTVDTNAYTAAGECAATGTYTARGKALTISPSIPGLSGTTAWVDFADLSWLASSITARGALIWNDTITTPVPDPAVVVLDFGSDKMSTAGDFTIVFPVADATNAIIRVS